MADREMSEEDKKQVAALTKRIARVIGRERPSIATAACWNIINLSAQLAAQLAGQHPAESAKGGE